MRVRLSILVIAALVITASPAVAKPLPLADGPGTGRASVLGTPFANKPVYFDDVVVGTTIGAP